mgnify:CR=1 FL=1
MTELITVEDWIAKRKFAEKGLRLYTNEIFAIFSESEKSVKAMLVANGAIVTAWLPKSLLKSEVVYGYLYTRRCASYEEALDALRYSTLND